MQLNYHYNLTIQLIFNPQLYLKQNITRFKQSILYESDIKAPRNNYYFNAQIILLVGDEVATRWPLLITV